MGVLKKIVKHKNLAVHKHKKFWKSVDTQKDAYELSKLLKNDKNKNFSYRLLWFCCAASH